MKSAILMLLATAAMSTPAAAEVRFSAPTGFELEQRATFRLPPARLFALVTDLPAWWSSAHTYSGRSANLSLAVKPGGCWCETLPGGGGVEHMRVAYVEPGKKIVMMGSLGPLLYEATSGVLQLTVEPGRDGGSSLIMNYRVAGFHKGGGERFAPVVDQVLGAQMAGLRQAAERQALRP